MICNIYSNLRTLLASGIACNAQDKALLLR